MKSVQERIAEHRKAKEEYQEKLNNGDYWVLVEEMPVLEVLENTHVSFPVGIIPPSATFQRYACTIDWLWEVTVTDYRKTLFKMQIRRGDDYDVALRIVEFFISIQPDTPIDNIKGMIRDMNSGNFFLDGLWYYMRITDGAGESVLRPIRYKGHAPDNYFVHTQPIVPRNRASYEDIKIAHLFSDVGVIEEWNNWTSVVIQKPTHI